MQENIITWNVANWITIVLMAALGFTLLGLLVSFIKKRQGPAVTAADVAAS